MSAADTLAPQLSSAQPRRLPSSWLPRTLFARLTLILFTGLALAYALSFTVIIVERDKATTSLMLGFMEQDVSSSVALLDRLPASERALWLPRLERRSYGFVLGPGATGAAPDERLSKLLATSIEQSIGTRYQLSANAVPGLTEHLQVHLKLSDGEPLTIDLRPRIMPLSPWLVPLLLLQLALLTAFSWLCVRLATRPLEELATAADALGPDLSPSRLAEDGPTEVARAASAFNAMQDRIAIYMTERMQILAAISHDLQTPITRMRLRADLMDDDEHRGTLMRNLQEMEALVREGVTYARTLHGAAEQPLRLDPDALLNSLIYDYIDADAAVTISGSIGKPLMLRPVALRRILTNLIDNALKYGGNADLVVSTAADGSVILSVLDQGPGIPAEKLEAVFQPFYRLEASRNRNSGGTGLGLAIARQLAQAIGGTLELHNRPAGGLEARFTLPASLQVSE
ncbi:ATP-binding protein [Undibacterium terreum]|uniref:histidine kinase n=1 Tax=Undibacterium terreum TaxID=1224302 RepID=A0A916U9Q4_9BURK|nr:ATP-binding protein [Undibacterium terreum]GGC64264.1 two-component sensor histidine kinase [Undibacterium terreum]